MQLTFFSNEIVRVTCLPSSIAKIIANYSDPSILDCQELDESTSIEKTIAVLEQANKTQGTNDAKDTNPLHKLKKLESFIKQTIDAGISSDAKALTDFDEALTYYALLALGYWIQNDSEMNEKQHFQVLTYHVIWQKAWRVFSLFLALALRWPPENNLHKNHIIISIALTTVESSQKLVQFLKDRPYYCNERVIGQCLEEIINNFFFCESAKDDSDKIWRLFFDNFNVTSKIIEDFNLMNSAALMPHVKGELSDKMLNPINRVNKP